MVDKSRRKLFGAFATSKKKETFPLRPPYAQNEALFAKKCFTCKEAPCVSVCEEGIIKIIDNTPIVDFANSGCSYCKECVDECPSDVLDPKASQFINANFSIDIGACLAWNEVVCFTCKDVCDEKAIEFFGMFRPQILKERCTSCGFCFSPCPTDAIKIEPKELV